MKLIEVFVWGLVAFLSSNAVRMARPMPLLDDSLQFINVAENFKLRHQIETSLVHFDTERSQGRIPAPLTSFGPLYPVLIAMVSFENDLENPARIVSVVSYSGTAALLSFALMLTGVTFIIRQLILLLFLTNVFAITFATAVMTEPLYLLASMIVLVGFIWTEKYESSQPNAIYLLVIAFVVSGFAYWIRYASVFLIVTVVCYSILRLLLPQTRLRVAFLLASIIPIMFSGIWMLRNLSLVGTWMGGSEKVVHNPIKDVMQAFIRVQLHLITGQHAVIFGPWEILLCLGVLITVGMFLLELRNVWNSKSKIETPQAATLLVSLYVLTYTAGMVYLGIHTVISFGSTRMFLPMLPPYLLLLGIGITWVVRRVGRRIVWLNAGLLLATLGYIGTNARDWYEPISPGRQETLASEYAEPTSEGISLRAWIESNIPASSPIVAADGQATGYFLRRPTLSMVGPIFSTIRWECADLEQQMKRFKADYVFLYKPSRTANNELLASSEFVNTSVSKTPACEFVIAAENSHVRILRASKK